MNLSMVYVFQSEIDFSSTTKIKKFCLLYYSSRMPQKLSDTFTLAAATPKSLRTGEKR